MLTQKSKQYGLDISNLICSLFDNESENHRYNLKDIDATAFFTGISLAFGIIYNRLCDERIENPMDIAGIQSKLLFQHFLKTKMTEGK